MIDQFGRTINYLRISVIDRCNLRCTYCMPHTGLALRPQRDILSFEEILAIVKTATKFGINKIRLTGGEPLIRRDLVELVRMLAQVSAIKDLALTTNGILLTRYASALKKAGLQRVNISLGTTDAGYFAQYTNGGNIKKVLAGIDLALAVGLTPVKINCVIDGKLDRHAELVKQLAESKKIEVRFIQKMDFTTGKFVALGLHAGGDCKNCNRLRLLSDGRILPCLFSDVTFSIRELGIANALTQAVFYKPKQGMPCHVRWMGEIGG